MKYFTILFDLDGVLITKAKQFSDRLEEIYGIPVARLQPFFTGVFLECGIGKADLKEELIKVIGDWGWKGSVDELLAFWFSTGTEIDQEVAAFVRELRRQGIKTYLTTDQEKYRGEYLRKMFGSGVLFDEVFYSAEIGCRKKDPAFFAYVDAHIDVDRQQVLFVDDGEKNIETAKAFGYDAHLFTDLDGLKAVLSTEL